LLEERPHLERDSPYVCPSNSRTGIEVDAQLVWMVEIA
jgi:hypothetical protein